MDRRERGREGPRGLRKRTNMNRTAEGQGGRDWETGGGRGGQGRKGAGGKGQRGGGEGGLEGEGDCVRRRF